MYNRIAEQLGHHSRQCKCANSIIKVDENCSIEIEAEYNIANPFQYLLKQKGYVKKGIHEV
jgi:hypothetical protein